MMKLLILCPSLLSLASSLAVPDPSFVTYEGWKVFRVKTGHALERVEKQLSTINYDEWHRVSEHVDVAISPDQLPAFEALEVQSHCMHNDLGASIAAESAGQAGKWKRQVDDMSWFDTYHPYTDHKQYFDDLQAKLPDNSEIISSGTSYEGREIFGIHLWGSEGKDTKPAVLWHGTVHAREWITAMVIEYITYQLVDGYPSNDTTAYFLDNYDFYILPFVNPDGFVFSQENERLWRKNRMPPPSDAVNQTCFGRDVNRNWPYEWDGNPLGASEDPCDLTYKGQEPGDTPENQGLQKLVNELRDLNGIKLYIDWHSYGQYILNPWGYNCTIVPEDVGEHIQVASLMSQFIRDEGGYGTTYTFGPSCSTLYPVTGSSVDYIYDVGKADWSYTIELRDTGDFGFVLPPDQIRPTAEETWVGIQLLLALLDEEFFAGERAAMEKK